MLKSKFPPLLPLIDLTVCKQYNYHIAKFKLIRFVHNNTYLVFFSPVFLNSLCGYVKQDMWKLERDNKWNVL